MATTQSKPLLPKGELVSIVCISYNHEKFITQALEGFVSQQHLDFDIEIIIADDASTDGTQKIIAEFQQKHSNLIHSILRNKNVGVQENLEEALCVSKGEYIALCEGDDYWTDSEKLQKQVDYMRKHKEAAVCFHPVDVIYEDDPTKKDIFPVTEQGRVFTFKDLLNENFIQTNAVMYRRLADYRHVVPKDILPLDWYMHILHASKSPDEPIGFICESMGVYRRHSHGIWQYNKTTEHKFWLKMATSHLRMHEEVVKLFEDRPEYQALAWFSAFKTAGVAYSVFARHDDYVSAGRITQEFPEYAARLIVDYKARLEGQSNYLDAANEKVYRQDTDAAAMQETIHNLTLENARIQGLLRRTIEYKLNQGVKLAKRSLKKKR